MSSAPGIDGYLQELRAQFLACREAWHGELVAELDDAGSPYDYLKRLTDVHRLHLFDVVMQYRAIFSDDSSAQVGSTLRGYAGAYGLSSGIALSLNMLWPRSII